MNERSTNEPNGDGRGYPGQLVPVTNLVPARREPYGPVAGYGDFADMAEEADRWDLLKYWRTFIRHKWLILSIAIAFVALGAVRTLMQTPLYTATARLQIDNPANVVEGGQVTPHDQTDSQSMRTQYELLRSRAMAKRVASSLKLGTDDEFLKPREFSLVRAVIDLLDPSASSEASGPKATARERAATGIVWSNVSVWPVAGSRLVDIAYSDPSPERAQKIANAFAEAAIDTSIDKRFQANAYAKTFLEDKIDQLKLRLEESERALVAFAESEEIVEVQERESITEANLATAHEVGTTAIENLRKQRNEFEIEYQEKLETFKPAYPTMVQIKRKIDGLDRQIVAETEEMNSKVTRLKAELLDLQKRSIQYNILKREVDTNRELYQNLLQRYKEVDVAGGVVANNVFTVDAATRPSSPSSPNLMRALMQALALGLLVGCGAAYGLERIDNRVRSGEDLEKLAGLPVLGVIPKVRGDVVEGLADPRSVLSEAYRSLATSLQFTTENGLPKSLMITSASPAEGKSLTALAVARHFAVMGRKVLLIDADLRNPSLHKKLDRDNETGLSNYLTGACTPPETMQKTSVPNLAFIASGPLPPNAADLLASPRLMSLLSVGLEVFDLIVIDGPPVLGLADAQLLSSATAATVFTVAAGETRTGALRGAMKRLQLSQGFVIGAVLTKFDAKLGSYGDDYGYGYGYGYSYGADANPRGLVVKETDNSKPQLTDARESA